MRIAFDTSPLVRPYPFGVERATRGLFEALSREPSIELVPVAPESGENERHWRHRHLPRLLQRLDCAGLHSPISAFPHRGPGRRVQTVHELPWRHGVRENADLAHRFWAAFGPWRADAVICPTEFVARDLIAHAPHAAGRVHVCPWGLESELAAGAQDEVRRAPLLRKYDLPTAPFALALGATRKKKNVAATLVALARSKSAELDRLHLVISGTPGPDLDRDLALARRFGLGSRVHTPGVIAAADLPALIAAARVVLVLSKSEGFAFPVLEALACATPVVVSEDSAQAEVAGPVGVRARIEDPHHVAAAILFALQLDDRARSALPARASEFPWSRCADQVARIWTSWAS